MAIFHKLKLHAYPCLQINNALIVLLTLKQMVRKHAAAQRKNFNAANDQQSCHGKLISIILIE